MWVVLTVPIYYISTSGSSSPSASSSSSQLLTTLHHRHIICQLPRGPLLLPTYCHLRFLFSVFLFSCLCFLLLVFSRTSVPSRPPVLVFPSSLDTPHNNEHHALLQKRKERKEQERAKEEEPGRTNLPSPKKSKKVKYKYLKLKSIELIMSNFKSKSCHDCVKSWSTVRKILLLLLSLFLLHSFLV